MFDFKQFLADHGSLVSAIGLVGLAVYDAATGNYPGALKAVAAAAGILHLWNGTVTTTPAPA